MTNRISWSKLPDDGLKIISYCPVCNTHYNLLSAKIIDEREDAHLIYLTCKNCGSSIVALIITGGMGVSSVGLVTDLTSSDVMRFKKIGEPVRSDEVIQFHQDLKNEKNLIKHLLKT